MTGFVFETFDGWLARSSVAPSLVEAAMSGGWEQSGRLIDGRAKLCLGRSPLGAGPSSSRRLSVYLPGFAPGNRRSA